MNLNINRFSVLLLTVLILRLVTLPLSGHAGNFAPIEAIALFSTAFFGKQWQSYLLPISLVLLSDTVLNYTFTGNLSPFYPGFYWQYLGYAVLVLLGSLALNNITLFKLIVTSTTGVFLFYLLSNFGVWKTGLIYPMTAKGLLTCYMMGLPYLQHSLLGTLFYSFMLYSLFISLQKKTMLLVSYSAYLK